MAANPNRLYLIIQNQNTTGDLYINFGAAAAVDTTSIKILPGGSFVMEGSRISQEAINGIGSVSIACAAKEG
jgi:hypothetical protein